MSETERPTTVEGLAARQLRRRVERVAADLERLAEEVRRATSGIDRIGNPGRRQYAQVASDVQHAVMNAMPNLGLDALTHDAADADIARAKGE